MCVLLHVAFQATQGRLAPPHPPPSPSFHAFCSEREIFTAILHGHLDFASQPWPSISEPAKGCFFCRARAVPVLHLATPSGHKHAALLATLCAGHLPMLVSAAPMKTPAWPSTIPLCSPLPAADLVRSILTLNVEERVTAPEILKHQWLAEQGVAPARPLDSVVISRLRNFAGMTKLRKAAIMAAASSLR